MSSIYKTIKGIEYQQGTIFKNVEGVENAGKFRIDKISENLVHYTRLDINAKYSISIGEFEMNIDTDLWEVEDNKNIIGYELLKSLPGIPAGTKSEKTSANGYRFGRLSGATLFPTRDELKDTTWFKPIYGKEIVVNISKNENGYRRVIVKGDKITLEYFTPSSTSSVISINEFMQIYNALNTRMSSDHFPITFNSIKVKCQVFTREDIESVYEALKSL